MGVVRYQGKGESICSTNWRFLLKIG
jgi:hypothetical protein